MMKHDMTPGRSTVLKDIMEWYWKFGEPKNLISKADYEFVYDIWNNGLSYYGNEIQKRLKKIRKIYIQSIYDESKKQ